MRTSYRVPSLLILAASLLLSLPARAETRLEGRILASKADGYYDLLIRIWDKRPAEGQKRLLQTMQVPKVKVEKGCFRIALDAGLDGRSESDLGFDVEGRPFEGTEPFRPAEVSRVQLASML